MPPIQEPKPAPRGEFQNSKTQKPSPSRSPPKGKAQPAKVIDLKVKAPPKGYQDTIPFLGTDFETNKQLSLYDEIRLADEMINQLSRKINKFAP